MNQSKIPITRMNKFFSETDFNLEQDMGREFIEGDFNVTIILYKVDAQNTSTDDLYNEAKKDDISYLPPLELSIIPIINEPVNKVYNTNAGSGRYEEENQFIFGIYQQQLDELETDLSFGDYIGYPINETQIVYFTIIDPHIKNYNNKHTIYGYKGAFRTIKCAPINENEFSGR